MEYLQRLLRIRSVASNDRNHCRQSKRVKKRPAGTPDEEKDI